MTTYVSSGGSVGGVFTSDTLSLIELRVMNNLAQQANGSSVSQEELRLMRNDEAFGLGISPAIVPGQ